MIDAAACQCALVEQDAAVRDRLDDVGDLSAAHGLEDVRAGTRLQGLSQGLVVVKGSQDDGEDLRVGGAQTVHNVDAGAVGQLQVDEDDVGAHEVGATHRVCDRTGLGDDLQRLVAVDDFGNTAPDDLMIVDDHNARARGSIFTHEFILTVRRAGALGYLFFFRGQPIHRVLRGRILRVLLRRGLPRSDRVGALGDEGMGGKHALMIGTLALHRIGDFTQALRL